LRAWLADLLAHGAARSDAILLRHANKRDADLDALAELAAATAPSRERQAETLNQGAAFMRAARSWGCPVLPDPVAYPVAVGALAGFHGIDADATATAYLQGVMTNLISAAVRLVPLGQSTGLAVLAALEPVILRVAAETRGAGLDDLGGAAFRSDLAAMLHETQYTRLFRS
jgi:urease accessory protein